MFGLEMRELLMIGGGALFGMVLFIFVVKSLVGGGRKKGRVKKQVNLKEELEDFPDPPPLKKGTARLWIDGVEARLRLVVISPTGAQQEAVDAEQVPELLNNLLRGLGTCVAADKARIRIWPPQLSIKGFVPTYFRLVESPEADGQSSHWVRLAGLTRMRGRQYLLGVALMTDDETDIGTLALEPNEWMYHLKYEK